MNRLDYQDVTSQRSPNGNAECRRFEADLNDWIDQSVADQARVIANVAGRNRSSGTKTPHTDPHLRSCTHCQQTLALWTQIDPVLPGPMASIATMQPRKMADKRRSNQTRLIPRLYQALLACAAGLVLMFTLSERAPTDNVIDSTAIADRNSLPWSSANQPRQSAAPEFAHSFKELDSDPARSGASEAGAPRRSRHVTTHVMALASSPTWAPHLAFPNSWRLAPGWFPANVFAVEAWVQHTSPAMGQFQTGVEPIGRTLRTVARLIAGDTLIAIEPAPSLRLPSLPSNESLNPSRLPADLSPQALLPCPGQQTASQRQVALA
jgi:hypothetical protein